MELGFIITFALVVIIDNLLIYKTGYSSLSIFITKCYYSKKYKWLAYNLWGDDSGFYKKYMNQLKQTSL